MTRAIKQRRKSGGRKTHHSETFRKQIASTVIREKLTLKEAAERFDVPNQTISRWVLQYSDDIEQTNVIESMIQSPEVLSVQELKLTEHDSQLNQAQLKIIALETMIKVAEEKYNISIRKNVGTKQHK